MVLLKKIDEIYGINTLTQWESSPSVLKWRQDTAIGVGVVAHRHCSTTGCSIIFYMHVVTYLSIVHVISSS